MLHLPSEQHMLTMISKDVCWAVNRAIASLSSSLPLWTQKDYFSKKPKSIHVFKADHTKSANPSCSAIMDLLQIKHDCGWYIPNSGFVNFGVVKNPIVSPTLEDNISLTKSWLFWNIKVWRAPTFHFFAHTYNLRGY